MNRRKYYRLNTLFLTFLCTVSMILTVWASPADNQNAIGSPVGAPGGNPGGPGVSAAEVVVGDAAKPKSADTNQKSSTSLGIFKTTGYCNCDICSAGHSLTYSGTVPKANHTLSADIDLFPIGTKLMIQGTVYTVEDIGGAVNGQEVDIFYDSHEEALAHGLKQLEVFMVE